MSDIGDWYKSLPVSTRHWFTFSVVFPIAARFGLLDPSNLILSRKISSDFQVS
jgi:PREDICTED: similar to der1-like domain family, member 1